MKITKAMLAAAVACGTMFSTVVYAEEEATPDFAMDTVVVTANRMENKLVDTPANVSVVTSEEIERRNYQDAIEAVKNVPGVNVTGSARADQNYIYINGSERVLILVDGRRINTNRGVTSGRATFDASLLPNPSVIERIEILKGGAATVYGSEAVGGVINIITKRALNNYVKVDVNTGSWGTQNYKSIVSHKEGKTGIFATFSKEKQNYIKYKEADTSEHKKMKNSRYQKEAVNIKVEQEIGEDKLATLFFEHSLKKGGRPGAVATWKHSDTADGSDLTNNVSLRYDWGINSDALGYVQVYRNYAKNEYFNSNTNWCNVPETTIGVDLQQQIKVSDNNKLIVGANYSDANVRYKGSMDPYDKTITKKSIFVQDSWNFTESWILNTGLRYNNHSNSGSKFTGSAAINKKFNDNSHAFVSWSQVYNTPTTDDLFTHAAYSIADPNLKPEKGNTYTLGYETKVGEKGLASISTFYSTLDDAIVWDWTHYSPMRSVNVDKQKRRGIELSYKHDINDNWSLNASYTYVKVENKNAAIGSDSFARDYNILPNQYKLGVSYNNAKWNVDLYGRGASGGAKATYVDSKYLTMDLSVNYKVKDNWKLYAKGYNLTNVAYAEMAGTYTTAAGHNAYTYPAAGRTFLIGTELTF